ncbi:hypothetical protein BH23ACT9_BH23ACT9_35560 [soil metagenome]
MALQENNAIGVLDLTPEVPRFTRLFGLGTVDHSGSDLSDETIPDQEFAQTACTGRRDWPVVGFPMPDGIALTSAQGGTYVLAAEEGDAREASSRSTSCRSASALLD